MLHNVTISGVAVNCSALLFVIKLNNAVWLGERWPCGDDFGAKCPGERVVRAGGGQFSQFQRQLQCRGRYPRGAGVGGKDRRSCSKVDAL